MFDLSKFKPEWLEFIELYLSPGYNATTAYQKVYNCSESAATSSSSRLLKNDDIKAYISYRRNLMIEDLNISKERNIEDLEKIKLQAIKEGKLSYAIQAIQTQNKMLGYDSPTEINHNIKQEQPIFGPQKSDDEKDNE